MFFNPWMWSTKHPDMCQDACFLRILWLLVNVIYIFLDFDSAGPYFQPTLPFFRMLRNTGMMNLMTDRRNEFYQAFSVPTSCTFQTSATATEEHKSGKPTFCLFTFLKLKAYLCYLFSQLKAKPSKLIWR